jgi:hypothetical protein
MICTRGIVEDDANNEAAQPEPAEFLVGSVKNAASIPLIPTFSPADGGEGTQSSFHSNN